MTDTWLRPGLRYESVLGGALVGGVTGLAANVFLLLFYTVERWLDSSGSTGWSAGPTTHSSSCSTSRSHRVMLGMLPMASRRRPARQR